MEHLNPKHVQEWRDSTIIDSLIELNLLSFEPTSSGYEAFKELMLDPEEDYFLTKDQKKALASGGWGFAMREISGELTGFGVAKPNTPRETFDEKKNKTDKRKYDIACGVEMLPYLPQVSEEAWKRVCDRYKYEYPDDFAAESFWEWLGDTDIPVIITEGLKKQLALLSEGFAAIALNGIRGGYGSKYDENGKVTHRKLVYEIAYFADGRQFYICFDQDEKPKTRKDVNNAGWQLAKLIDQEQEDYVKNNANEDNEDTDAEPLITKTIELPDTEAKGVDDFLAAYGLAAFEKLIDQAETPSKMFFAEDRRVIGYPTVIAPTEIRYLNDCWDSGLRGIPGFAKAKIVALCADKSVGKSYAMSRFVEQEGLPVVNLSHRRSLGRETSSKFAINYAKEEPGWAVRLPGMGLCVDSLHKNCKASFNIANYTPGEFIVIIDEVEQFLKHLLQSTTEVAKHRQQILRNLQWLLANAKKVIVADADMSLVAITFLEALAKAEAKAILIVKHTRKAAKGRNCYLYDSEAALVAEIERLIDEGKRVFVFSDAQSGKFGTANLERVWRKKFGNLKLIRFDRETLEDEESEAFKAMGRIHQACRCYQLVLGSPSIATGVSFDVEANNDFDAVVGFFRGTLDIPDGLQALSRVRNGCDRHIFIREKCHNLGYKISKYATKESLVSEIIDTQAQDSLEFSSFDAELEEWHGYTVGLETYSKQIARENRRKWDYKNEILRQLKYEGYVIKPIQISCNVGAIETLHSNAADDTKKEKRKAISEAKIIDDEENLNLLSKQSKTSKERASCERHFIDKFYGEEHEDGKTSEFLIALHEDKLGERIRNLLALQSYLDSTEYLQNREDSIIDYWLSKSEESGKKDKVDLFAPDLAKKSKVSGLKVLERVGFFDILKKFYKSNETFNKETPEIVAFWEQYQQLDTKDKILAGYKSSTKSKAIQGIRKLLERFNLALSEPSGASNNRRYRIVFYKNKKLLYEFGKDEAYYNNLISRVIAHREGIFKDLDFRDSRVSIELQYAIAEIDYHSYNSSADLGSTIINKYPTEKEIAKWLEEGFVPSEEAEKFLTGNCCDINARQQQQQLLAETADMPF